jgi:hypothetical protein
MGINSEVGKSMLRDKDRLLGGDDRTIGKLGDLCLSLTEGAKAPTLAATTTAPAC